MPHQQDHSSRVKVCQKITKTGFDQMVIASPEGPICFIICQLTLSSSLCPSRRRDPYMIALFQVMKPARRARIPVTPPKPRLPLIASGPSHLFVLFSLAKTLGYVFLQQTR